MMQQVPLAPMPMPSLAPVYQAPDGRQSIFGDPRGVFRNGELFVKTAQPFYEKGQVVTGKIYIYVVNAFVPNSILMQVKGKEKVRFEMRYHHGHRTDYVERKGIMRFLDFEDDAFKFNGQPLMPGHYIIPFEFKLPTDIPSSMQFKDERHKDKPCMKIKFHIRVNLLCQNEQDNMLYKQIMVIRTAVPPFKEGEKNLQQI